MILEARFTAQDIPSQTMEPPTTRTTTKRHTKTKEERKAFLDKATHCLKFADNWKPMGLDTTTTQQQQWKFLKNLHCSEQKQQQKQIIIIIIIITMNVFKAPTLR